MRGKKGSNFQFQRTVHGIIPETCEMIDGVNSECREIVVQLHIIAGWLGAEARLLL
jgi:hypothetical protein